MKQFVLLMLVMFFIVSCSSRNKNGFAGGKGEAPIASDVVAVEEHIATINTTLQLDDDYKIDQNDIQFLLDENLLTSEGQNALAKFAN